MKDVFLLECLHELHLISVVTRAIAHVLLSNVSRFSFKVSVTVYACVLRMRRQLLELIKTAQFSLVLSQK